MKRYASFLVVLVMLMGASARAGQQISLPEFTDQQRWERLAFLMVGWQAAMVALGESHGMTPEEVGEWAGKYFSQSWLSGSEAIQFLRGTHRNFMAMPGAAVEVVSSTPTSVTARFNRPLDSRLGPARQRIGVPGDAIRTMLDAHEAVVAEWVGVTREVRADGDHDVVTLETQYGPIQASNDIRWARGSYLSWLNFLQLMSMRKEAGLTAREIGAADARLYAPTWGAQTPWQFFRGMVWNQMSDPNSDCEVLSASPREVRARCRQHYVDVVTNNQARFNVSPEDVFESGRAFASGVAEHLGMQWTEVLEDGYRIITVTVR